MQLSTLKISNLLSFPYVENLTEMEGVKFHNSEEGVINIIIWPNGSGKSNLLDIVHAMWKYGITINYELITSRMWSQDENTTTPFTIELCHTNTAPLWWFLSKHRGSEHLPAHVYFSLLMTQHDMDNLCFVNKYAETINTIIKKHSSLDIQFHTVDKTQLVLYNKIPLYFTIDTTNGDIILRRHNIDPVMTLIYDYLQHFELIQLCMQIYNNQCATSWEKQWYPLHNTFAIITSHSRTGQSNNGEIPKPIRLFLKKYHGLVPTDNESDPSLLKKFFLDSVNNTLRHYIGLHLNYTDTNSITFEDTEWYKLNYDELSSGEQSFVSIILFIYSHDLHNGLMIIDEPEIHLHPQSQELFIELLEDMKRRQKMQFVIATHAPSMINEHNINHVFRCHKEHHASTIVSPHNHIGEDDATLLQMLKFDHIAKIFFVDTIILVEGETDMYFFSHYLNYLKGKSQRSKLITNYEIVTIGGKWWFKRRKHFLTRFGINTHYIGDRDNIIEYGIVPSINKHLIGHHKHHHSHSSSPHSAATIQPIHHGGSKYEATIAQMKQFQANKYQEITNGIRKLYADNVYLLMEGDLEAYLWLPAKGLDDTVEFCQHHFLPWLEDHHYDAKRRELDDIAKKIFDRSYSHFWQ